MLQSHIQNNPEHEYIKEEQTNKQMPPILRMPYQQPAVVNQCNRLNKCSKRIDRVLNFLLQSWTLHVKIIFQSVLHCVCSTLMFVNTKSLTGWNAKQYNVIRFQPHLYLWGRFQILFFRQLHWFHSCEVIVTSSDELRRNERSFTSMHDHRSWHETLNLLLSNKLSSYLVQKQYRTGSHTEGGGG